MSDVEIDEPGSPLSLGAFRAWCRAAIALAVSRAEVPKLLFADGPDYEDPLIVAWQVVGVPASTEAFLERVVPDWIDEADASQLGVGVPYGGEEPGVVLLTADETGICAESACVELVDDELRLQEWEERAADHLPFADWQPTLAANAGYRDFTKWRCRQCRSVCPGEADVVPAPCDFCGGHEIESVPATTPLADPKPPYDEPRVAEVDPASPFVQTLLGIINGRRQG